MDRKPSGISRWTPCFVSLWPTWAWPAKSRSSICWFWCRHSFSLRYSIWFFSNLSIPIKNARTCWMIKIDRSIRSGVFSLSACRNQAVYPFVFIEYPGWNEIKGSFSVFWICGVCIRSRAQTGRWFDTSPITATRRQPWCQAAITSFCFFSCFFLLLIRVTNQPWPSSFSMRMKLKEIHFLPISGKRPPTIRRKSGQMLTCHRVYHRFRWKNNHSKSLNLSRLIQNQTILRSGSWLIRDESLINGMKQGVVPGPFSKNLGWHGCQS